jgi:surface antigen
MKTKNIQKLSRTLLTGAVVATVIASTSFPFVSNNAQAATLNELRARSQELQEKIEANNARAEKLAGQADTLENTIAKYNSQIQAAEDQIELISARIQELDIELKKAQKELDRQKEILKATFQALYKLGGASTVELLVGSDSFSQYFNDQAYIETLKSGVQESTQKVIELKQKIQAQQAEQKNLLSQQQYAKEQAEGVRAQKQNLLKETQGQEAKYRQVTKELQEEQRKLLNEIVARSTVVVSSSSGGGYPAKWANAPLDAFVDDWGMFTRECTSYAAWKVASTGRNMPAWGYSYPANATQWPGLANAFNIPTGTTPKVGAVAVWYGYYGHVAYVEQVYGNGQIRVSEYNVPAWSGNYSERIMSGGDPDVYIYF